MDKAKKNRIKKYIGWIAMALVVALLAVMPLLAQKEQEEDGPVASILEASVTLGDMETGIQGGGTLSAGKAVDVKLPTGVKITGFLVKNGDTVAEGDPVATVDKVSVMTAIVQVRETLEYIQDEMADARNEAVSSTLSATAGGRVKEVYAQAGDSVQDVMLRHGALAVLSLDGLMAVDLEGGTGLASGDTVYAAFEDGTQVTGRVENDLDGKLVVTLEDDDYKAGTLVTVTREDGSDLGTGALYVHNAWRAMAFSGTVGTVYAKENTNVYEGSTLFTLKDTDFEGTLLSFASLHREYEELLQDLFAMHESGVITAPGSGLVSGVDETSEFLLSAIDGQTGWFVDLLSAPVQEESGWTVMLLSNTEEICTGDESCKAKKHENGCPMKCTGREGCTAVDHDPGCAVFCTMLPDCANLNHKTGCLGVCTGNGDTCQSTRSHEYHQKSCIKRCISDLDEDPVTTCDANVHYAACIENCTGGEDCPALTHKEGCWFHGVTYTAIAVQVKLVALEGLQVVVGSTTYQVTPEGTGWKLVAPEELQDVFVGESVLLTVADPSQYGEGDILLIVTGTNSSGQTVYQDTVLYQKGQQDQPGGFPGGMGGFGGMSGMGGMGGMGAMGGTATGTEFELFDLEGDVLMTVTEQDVMTLSIQIDEQDINKVFLGQSAQVKITPLKGRTFEAEVTDIGTEGANNGGSSKFTLELTLAMEEDMLSGMSATAWLPLSVKKDVLTVPVAALAEEEGRTVVYTALDPETGNPAAPVEVTTGISDGENVEILSGLERSAVIYYSYYDTAEISTEVESGGFSFG